jgi:hypothetical protein
MKTQGNLLSSMKNTMKLSPVIKRTCEYILFVQHLASLYLFHLRLNAVSPWLHRTGWTPSVSASCSGSVCYPITVTGFGEDGKTYVRSLSNVEN